jgi:hypothetical protein
MCTQPTNGRFAILDLRWPGCGWRQSIIDRGDCVTVPEEIQWDRVQAIAGFVTVYPASTMNDDDERYAVTIGRQVEVQLLERTSAGDVGDVC